jgi:hypothetical protein
LRIYWQKAYQCNKPSHDLASLQPQTDIYTLGITKYLARHRNKVQLNLSYQREQKEFIAPKDFFNIMLQVEVGI